MTYFHKIMVKIINLEKIKKERCEYSPLTRPAPAPYVQSHFLIFQIPFKKDGGGEAGGGGPNYVYLQRVSKNSLRTISRINEVFLKEIFSKSEDISN